MHSLLSVRSLINNKIFYSSRMSKGYTKSVLELFARIFCSDLRTAWRSQILKLSDIVGRNVAALSADEHVDMYARELRFLAKLFN